MNLFGLTVIIITWIFIIVTIISSLKFKSLFNECHNKESPYCFTLTCETENDKCGKYAYREENGNTICSF